MGEHGDPLERTILTRLADLEARVESHDELEADKLDVILGKMIDLENKIAVLNMRVMAPARQQRHLRVVSEQASTFAEWARIVRVWRDAWLAVAAAAHGVGTPVTNADWVRVIIEDHARLITRSLAEEAATLLSEMARCMEKWSLITSCPDHKEIAENLHHWAGVYHDVAELHAAGEIVPGSINSLTDLVIDPEYVRICAETTSVTLAMEIVQKLAILAEFFEGEARRLRSEAS